MAEQRREASAPSLGSIRFDEFTESTMRAILRAVEAQKLPHGPILIGIIWRPELGPQEGAPEAQRTRR